MEIELESNVQDEKLGTSTQSGCEDEESQNENANNVLVQADSPCSPLLSNTVVPLKKISLTGQDLCRICHCEAEPDSPLVAPCRCSGSLQYVHQSCLQRWVQSSDTRSCELCKYPFVMQTKVKPLKEWEKLDMSRMEQRKLACSVTFHAVAFTCVVWSLYVLIDRSAEEYSLGQLQWPFWTKLVVVAIGFTGGVVFMYVQCTMYVSLCRRWRAYNRVILVQDRPLKPSSTTVEITSLSSPNGTSTQGRWKSDKTVEAGKNTTDLVQPVVTIAMGHNIPRDVSSYNVPRSGNELPSEQPEETAALLDSKSLTVCPNLYSKGNVAII